MPLTKEALKRYMILDGLLSDPYHNYTLDDLTDEVSNRMSARNSTPNGVVRRTIEKDLDAIQLEPFYAEIERYSVVKFNKETQKERRRMCLRYADPSFSIFKKELTDDEKNLLRDALALIGQFEGLPKFQALESMLKGLEINEPNRKIISFTKNPLERSNLLGELFTAISNRQVIELHYHKFSDPENVSQYNVIPYLLKEYNRRWYLIAAAESDGKLLNFALDRMNKVVPLPSHPYVEFDGDINERFEEIIGVSFYSENPVQKIIFWVSDNAKDYIETKPLHETHTPIRGENALALRERFPMLKGGAFYKIECRENYELIRELTLFGKELLVLEPSEIQKKVFQRIDEMRNDYAKILAKPI